MTNVKSKNSTFIKANLNRKKDKITIFLLWNTTEQFRYEDNTSKRTSSSLASVSHSMIFLFDVDLELNSLFVFTHQEAFLRIRCGKIKIKVRLGRKHFTGTYSTFTFSSVNRLLPSKCFDIWVEERLDRFHRFFNDVSLFCYFWVLVCKNEM